MFSPKQGKCKECRNNKAKTNYISQAKPKSDKPEPTAKYTCECGGTYTHCNKATHMKTAKHKHTMIALHKTDATDTATHKQDAVRPDVILLKKIAIFNDIIKNKQQSDLDEQKLWLQQSYTIYKNKLLETFKIYNDKQNIKDECLGKEAYLNSLIELKQNLQSVRNEGKSLVEEFNNETDPEVATVLNKELDKHRFMYAEMKNDLLKKIAFYNVKFINKVEDALEI